MLLVSFVVGFFIGAVGVGGILLIPALTTFAGLSIHESAATALFTFIFTGIAGTWLFQRRGSISWRVSLPVCAGAVLFSFIGAMVNSMVNAQALNLIIALIIIFAGAYILIPSKRPHASHLDGRSKAQQLLLLAVGAVSGFGSGLSGAGGPLFSVPIMVLLGFFPLTAIGTSQVLQIISAASGSLGNLQYGSINFTVAAWITALELAGVFVGVRLAHAAKMHHLRNMAAALCIAVGGAMLVKSL